MRRTGGHWRGLGWPVQKRLKIRDRLTDIDIDTRHPNYADCSPSMLNMQACRSLVLAVVIRSLSSRQAQHSPCGTLYHGHPCRSFWLGPEIALGLARLSLRQEGRTRVEALVEGAHAAMR